MIEIEDILDEAIQYLEGKMDIDERIAFEYILDKYPHLKEDLHFMQLVRLGLQNINEQEEIEKSSKKGKKPFLNPDNRNIIGLGLLLLFSLFLFWVYPRLFEIEAPKPIIIHSSQLESKSGSPDNEYIDFKQLGGDDAKINSDRGRAVAWTRTNKIALAGTFSGRGKLGAHSFSSLGERDMFVGIYNPDYGFELLTLIRGREGSDMARGIAVDKEGDLLITGGFGGKVNFGNGTVSAIGTDDMGNHDFFVAKYNTLSQLQWVDHHGGHRVDHQQTGTNMGLSVITDSEDNVIVSGEYIDSLQFAGEKLPIGGPNGDLFLAKYAPNGRVNWVNYVTGNYMVYGMGVNTDASGNIYLTGNFGHHNLGGQANFQGDTTLVSFGGRDIFLAKYNPDGNLVWAQQAGSAKKSNGHDQANGIAIDTEGNIIIAGMYDGDARFGKDILASIGGRDIFIAKYDPSGGLIWCRQAGSPQGVSPKIERATAVAIDENDNSIVITGSFTEIAHFDKDHAPLITNGDFNFFVAKYSQEGDIIWSESFEELDGFQQAEGNGIDINQAGQIAVTGFFTGSVSYDLQTLESQGQEDIFLLILDRDGNLESINAPVAYNKK